jgi:microcystin-dependent protein
MPLENMNGLAAYPDVLNNAWPTNSDTVDIGNEHIYGVKNVLINWSLGYETADLKTQVTADIDAALGTYTTSVLDPSIDANNAILAPSLVIPGVIIIWPADTDPIAYLLCDGTQYTTAAFPDLFGVIGYLYGGSGGNFNVPDLRAEFVRGWDEGKGVDAGRALGSNQAADLEAHGHAVTDAGHAHTASVSTAAGATAAGGSYNMPLIGSSPTTSDPTGLTVDDSTGVETRPINVAMRYMIKT